MDKKYEALVKAIWGLEAINEDTENKEDGEKNDTTREEEQGMKGMATEKTDGVN